MTDRPARVRTTLYMGISLDGFVARPDDGLDFLPPPPGDGDNGFAAFLSTVDVIVMGRRTFEVVLRFGPGQWPYGALPVVVLSRSLDAAPLPPGWPGHVQIRAGEPAQVLQALAEAGHRHAYVDGAATARAFLQAGLLDRLVLTQVPVLIGTGITPWGPLSADIPLRLASSRTLPGGMVQSVYELAAAAP